MLILLITLASGPSFQGTWQLTEIYAVDKEGKEVYRPKIQDGYLILQGNYYSLMWTNEPRPNPEKDWGATKDEALHSFYTMIAHQGTWESTSDKLVMHAKVAKSPEFVGGQEFFDVEWDGNHLILTATKAISINKTNLDFYIKGGKKVYRFKKVD